MKPSYYNILVDNEDGSHILYNTRTRALAVLDARERALYEGLSEEGGSPAEAAAEVSDPAAAALMGELAGNGFILDDPEQEAIWLEYEFQKYKHSTRYFELTICPTLDCNYRCPYCYEKKRPGKMSPEVQDALMRFVEEGYEENPFRQLRIDWYGGEPLLAPDVIESLSARFIDFCERKGVDYWAALMTNGSLADEAMMERMARCRIGSVMIAFGGHGACHDRERIAVDGSSTYQAVHDNALRIAQSGIATNVTFVVDHDNYDNCMELAAELGTHDNIYYHLPCRKADYNGDLFKLDEQGNEVPMFRFLDAEQIDRFAFESFMLGRHDAAMFEERMTPLNHFCGCSMEYWYVVDELGYVYKCICDVDKPETHALYNICEPRETRRVNWKRLLHFAGENPMASELCRTCRIYPLCNGFCYRTNEVEGGDFYRQGDSCRAQMFKHTIEDFVREYYRALVREGRDAR